MFGHLSEKIGGIFYVFLLNFVEFINIIKYIWIRTEIEEITVYYIYRTISISQTHSVLILVWLMLFIY